MTTATVALTLAHVHTAAEDQEPQESFADTWALTTMAAILVGVIVFEAVATRREKRKQKARPSWL